MDNTGTCQATLPHVLPDMNNNVGHFNVFKAIPFVAQNTKPLPYQRRDYFKILLVFGGFNIQYADKVIAAQKHVLMFSNPNVPYSIENFDHIDGAVYCVFSKYFFYNFGNLKDYGVFQPGNVNIFELDEAKAAHILNIFERMLTEINTDYSHKYDLLRNYVFEILHFAQKTLPFAATFPTATNASQRIANLFVELLERQFPIDETHRTVTFRTPADFATQLNVHVNHLNRAAKQATNKTSSDLINERFIKEAKILLKQTTWNVSEICHALGFREVAYFSNYFKKHTTLSPQEFRSV